MQEENPYHERWLRPTRFLDFDAPTVRTFALDRSSAAQGDRAKAIALYYAVRDEFRYDPYRVEYAPSSFSASGLLERGHGFCLPKATLLAASARALGIPARLGYGDVRNHLTTERLRQSMGTDVFVFHGYAQLWIDDRWVKATPAFNRTMCDRFGVKPLEFDGVNDSLFHEFDAGGRRHMEYVRDRGIYDDVPFEEILSTWREVFPSNAADRDAPTPPLEFEPDA